jgi:hypothetical protein
MRLDKEKTPMRKLALVLASAAIGQSYSWRGLYSVPLWN